MTSRATDRGRFAGVAGAMAGLAVLAVLFAPDGTAARPVSCGDDALVRFLERRVREDPEDFVAQNRLAIACVERSRESGNLALLDLAASAARASLEAGGPIRNAGGLVALALVRLESHRFGEARDAARRARQVDPASQAAIALEGDAELELGNEEEAARLYALLASPDSAAVLARRARLAELDGEGEKAIDLLAHAAMAEPRLNLRRGELLLRAGRVDDAERAYLAAPPSWSRREHLAELRAVQGRLDEAATSYEQVIAEVPRPELMQTLGDLENLRGNAAAASRWHARAERGYLDSTAAGEVQYFHHLAGLYSESLKRPAEALRWAKRDLELRRSRAALAAYSWALYLNDRFDEAATVMDEAMARGSSDAHVLGKAGLVYWRAGRLDEGRALVERANRSAGTGAFHVHRG